MAWFVLLIVGSLQPVRPKIIVAFHREVHWIVFGVAALILFALSETRREEIRGAFMLSFLCLSLELGQHLANRQPLEWSDIRDDSLAIAVTLVLYRLAGARKRAAD
jgi:hypothetical protein